MPWDRVMVSNEVRRDELGVWREGVEGRGEVMVDILGVENVEWWSDA